MADIVYMAKSKWRELLDTIRTKSGTSASMTADQAIAAVEAIETGGGTPFLPGITEIFVYSQTESELECILPNLGNLNVSHNSQMSLQTIDIQTGNALINVSAFGGTTQQRGGALKTLDLHGAKISFLAGTYGCRYRENLEEVNAKCVMLVTNTGNQFNGTTKLKTIYWQENAQTINLSLAACALLTDDSIVSIANGLKGGTVATLTLHATPKARCSTLMGTVSQVTEDSETYDFFTQDDSGTVTLADFITTVKGWTLA